MLFALTIVFRLIAYLILRLKSKTFKKPKVVDEKNKRTLLTCCKST